MNPDDTERDQLEILASDFMDRLRRGEAPAIEEYAAAHPDLAAEIRDLFPTIAATEGLKTRRLSNGQTRTRPELVNAPTRASQPHDDTPGTESPAVRSGLRLGKYVLQERLGQGSLGTVWRSSHPELGIPLAIKVLRPELIGRSKAQVQRFLREAHTAAKLNHPHIVRVFDAGYDQGLYFLVMEFIEGGSLGELLRQAGGKLTVPRALEIVTAMAEALHAAAEFGIVHRDIKPDNILLDRKGTPKLADLGLAKQLSEAEQPELTGTGMGLGTPLYVAPEQAMGEGTPDARADIYSLGATFYHLVTGTPPFTGATAYQIVHRHAHLPVVDPRSHNPEISAELAGVIQRMLAKDPNDRYPNAQELLNELTRLAAGQAPAPWQPTPHATPRPAWLVPALTATAAVIAIGGIATWWAMTHNRNSTVGPSALGTAPAAITPNNPLGAGTPSPPGRERIPGRVRPADWELSEGAPGPDLRPVPLKAGEYEFVGGILRLLPTAVRHPSTLVYEPAVPGGAVTIVIEARNLVECGFMDTAGCRIVLRDPARPPSADGPWQTIEIRRNRGELTCTVDGQPAYAVERPQATRGRFLIPLPQDRVCELRKFSVTRGDAQPPGPRPAEPLRRDPPPPRDDGPPR